jgi:hypothetical protein
MVLLRCVLVNMQRNLSNRPQKLLSARFSVILDHLHPTRRQTNVLHRAELRRRACSYVQRSEAAEGLAEIAKRSGV